MMRSTNREASYNFLRPPIIATVLQRTVLEEFSWETHVSPSRGTYGQGNTILINRRHQGTLGFDEEQLRVSQFPLCLCRHFYKHKVTLSRAHTHTHWGQFRLSSSP